jgi:hypothetical protein
MAAIANAQADSTVRILLDRLNWPIRMVRWLAAREFAGLLSRGAHQKKATEAYLDWLSIRQFESQVVSGLAVLLCMHEETLPPFLDECEHINRPSIVADLMLQHVYGYGKRRGGWLSAHSGPCPNSFASERYFEDHKGAHVPPIFGDDLKRLEGRSGRPFTRHWAFEWRKLMDVTKSPYSGFPYHFVGSTLQRSGVFGQFSQAQCDVYRSAYLRTLAFAVSQWELPLEEAAFYSSICLPLNGALAHIKPIQRPDWLADIPERCCEVDSALDELTRDLVKAGNGQPGMRPVNLEIPIKASLFEFGNLSVSAVLVSEDFVPDPDDSSYFAQHTGWILPDGITFAGTMDKKDPADFVRQGSQGASIPVCLSLWPFPSGFWHNDYFASGLALPSPYNFSDPPEIACNERDISMHLDGTPVGILSIWHDHWTPLYPKGGNTRCGMLTQMREIDLESSQTLHGMELGWVVQLRLWSRKTDYGEYELKTRRQFFRDG